MVVITFGFLVILSIIQRQRKRLCILHTISSRVRLSLLSAWSKVTNKYGFRSFGDFGSFIDRVDLTDGFIFLVSLILGLTRLGHRFKLGHRAWRIISTQSGLRLDIDKGAMGVEPNIYMPQTPHSRTRLARCKKERRDLLDLKYWFELVEWDACFRPIS